MTPQELLRELETTSQRIDNLRVAEKTLIKEFSTIVEELNNEIERARQSRRPIIGPEECKERINELEEENNTLREELSIKNSAVIALQKSIQEGSVNKQNDKSNSRKGRFSFFRGTNSN